MAPAPELLVFMSVAPVQARSQGEGNGAIAPLIRKLNQNFLRLIKLLMC